MAQSSTTKSSTVNVSGGLTVDSLEQSTPQHSGSVIKLRMPILYSILPFFLQKWILQFWFLSFLRPTWVTRYLILLGSYLYKFESKQSRHDPPKGSPVLVEQIHASVVVAADERVGLVIQQLLPIGYTMVICVSTLRKKTYYACSTQEDALAWVNSLREGRQEAITRAMGHAPEGSYPRSWSYFDRLGHSLMQSKARVRRSMEDKSLHEIEMSNLTEGGPAPRGYFG